MTEFSKVTLIQQWTPAGHDPTQPMLAVEYSGQLYLVPDEEGGWARRQKVERLGVSQSDLRRWRVSNDDSRKAWDRITNGIVNIDGVT